MAVKIRDFSKIEQFIKQNSTRAMELSAQWTAFARNNPIVNQFQTADQFHEWINNNPQLAIDSSIWEAREVQAAFSEIRYNQARSQYEQLPQRGATPGAGGVTGLLAVGPLALFMRNRPELMQQDSKYQKVQELLKKQWLADHPDKTLDSEEGINYIHGALDDENAPPLDEQAERLFREKHQKEAEKYDKKRVKIYKNPDDDPALQWTKARLDEHVKARAVNLEEARGQIEQYEWDRFVARYPEKAAKYASGNQALTVALERQEKRETQKLLEEQAQKTGVEQKPVFEKVHRPAPEISAEEATRRLEQIAPPAPSPALSIPEASPGLQETVSSTPPSRQLSVTPPMPIARKAVTFLISQGTKLAGFFANPAGVAVIGAAAALIGLTFFILFFGEGSIPFLFQGPTEEEKRQFFVPIKGLPLTYKISFRDSSITPLSKETVAPQIEKEFSQARLDYWDHIVARSVNNEWGAWNPAFVLALWIEETGASHHTKVENGGSGATPLSKGHLGCSPKQEQTLDESLNCLFKNFSQYPNEQFEIFMRRYSGELPNGPFIKNPKFPTRLQKYYNMLVPGGAESLAKVSCPVEVTTIQVYSNDYYNKLGLTDPLRGHCTQSFENCGPGSRRAKSIDINTGGADVKFPTIEGKRVQWFFVPEASFNLTPNNCEPPNSNCGNAYVFQARVGPNTWTLHLLHIDPFSIRFKTGPLVSLGKPCEEGTNESGCPVGKTPDGIVLHINIGLNVPNPNSSPPGGQDFREGWINPEDAGMCI